MRSFPVWIVALFSTVALAADPVAPAQTSPKPAPAPQAQQPAVPVPGAPALGPKATPEEDQAIRQTFAAYQSALEKKDGKAAAALVDADTVRYYGSVQKLALEAPAATVRQQSVIDKLMILRMRAEFPADKLKKYTPEQLIAIGVDRGWVGSNTAENQIGDIYVNGTLARGQAMVQGEPMPLYHQFHKESGKWKLSLVALTRAVGPVMNEAARRLDLTEDEFVMFMLEQGLPKKPGEEIWDAPKPAAKKK